MVDRTPGAGALQARQCVSAGVLYASVHCTQCQNWTVWKHSSSEEAPRSLFAGALSSARLNAENGLTISAIVELHGRQRKRHCEGTKTRRYITDALCHGGAGGSSAAIRATAASSCSVHVVELAVLSLRRAASCIKLMRLALSGSNVVSR